ncbi:MAG: hypothetical protein KTR31_30690, partial [Myxococcales bacterium]|nr:hypothetical protein [Myxococcales bacterium]
DGAVVTARAAGAAPHELTADPSLGSAAFCEGCHDFAVPDVRGLHLVATGSVVLRRGTTR